MANARLVKKKAYSMIDALIRNLKSLEKLFKQKNIFRFLRSALNSNHFIKYFSLDTFSQFSDDYDIFE